MHFWCYLLDDWKQVIVEWWKNECHHKWTQNINCTSHSFGHNVMSFSTTATNLGFHLTDDMRIDAHVQDIYRKAYIDIRRISSIRHLLSIDATKTLLSAFVNPKLDFCNSLFYDSPMYLLWRSWKVQNKAARLLSQTKSHFTPSLVSALATH